MRAIPAIRPGFGVLPPVTDKYKTMKINASASFSSSADRSGRRHRVNVSAIPRGGMPPRTLGLCDLIILTLNPSPRPVR